MGAMDQERRRTPRVQCYLPIRLVVQGERQAIETLTKDLGVGGLRCLSPVLKPASTPVSVDITLEAGERPVSVQAQVVWLKEVPHSEQFHLGVVFNDLSDADTKRLSRYLHRISSQQAPASA